MKQPSWFRVFPHQLAWLIDNPLRRLFVSPQKVADRLALADSSRVLEIGPGSGFFSAALAMRVPNGRLELFDLQPEMLAKAKRKLTRRRLQNVGYACGDAGEDLPYPDAAFDVAFLSSVLGEVTNPDRCLGSLHRVLRPDGRLALHESIPDPDMIGFKRLRKIVEGRGFQFQDRWGPVWSYTAVFTKVRTPSTQ